VKLYFLTVSSSKIGFFSSLEHKRPFGDRDPPGPAGECSPDLVKDGDRDGRGELGTG